MTQDELLARSRGGDQEAFGRLVEPHRDRLHAHCRRMLGSPHDAEDALQEALLRAWRGLAGFDGRAALSSWLYRIATNACLSSIESRSRRAIPIAAEHPLWATGAEPAADSPRPEGDRSATSTPTGGPSSPAADYERRENLELAFVAALVQLSANQRAALILREVLGFSAREIAETLETSIGAVNSALQRARRALDERPQGRGRRATARRARRRAARRACPALRGGDRTGRRRLVGRHAE